MFAFAMALYFADSLVLLSFVQLLVLLTLLGTLYLKSLTAGAMRSKESRECILRFMEVLLFLQCLLTYVF
jgi:hypothetical protein